ncbi:related to GRE2 - methylglyoxal reductase (NADPH-dependent) [Melanopsichium pennsylvanicum]|uniref:Related to GRE2 - methylglyoxal reductase (NADPH-dependent) n=2 Tax=Melanopsichium pennsylvanicum TaxID=63383 RepID=A0AAJ4XTN6_9BASI|nr:related to GRE2-methylglyoxal reductase (NADPH-dependent) [Melanopsichium pennsylvanicum 4]SNX88046.1 related to GRE2 - methylglyoxal reductase (NADPH-dependent) [Melanopsichium pennsylvanicum]
MPAIQSNSHILVTGGSGFIAIWCVYQLLERGHKVRATVRSNDKGEYLQKLFQKYGDSLSFTIAEDLEKEGAFDEAVKGVDAVLHTASPFHFNIEGDPKRTLINPAVNGTRNVLTSISKHGSNVKRVVITSSFAAILDSSRQGHIVYTEKDWNISSVENVEKKGKDQEGPDAYRASKTMAERATWQFVEENKPSWDLVTINPPLVFGPILHQVDSPEKLNTSVGFVWGLLHGSKKEDDLLAPAGNCVDVRDVAYAHVEALVRSDAGGNRFATSLGPFVYQDVVDIIHSDSSVPSDWKNQVTKGKQGQGSSVKQNELNGSKATRVLDLKYIQLRNVVQDMVASLADYEKRGWSGVPNESILSRTKQ